MAVAVLVLWSSSLGAYANLGNGVCLDSSGQRYKECYKNFYPGRAAGCKTECDKVTGCVGIIWNTMNDVCNLCISAAKWNGGCGGLVGFTSNRAQTGPATGTGTVKNADNCCGGRKTCYSGPPPPTAFPTASPTPSPTKFPTAFPSAPPSKGPTKFPTAYPSASPTEEPTGPPTAPPTTEPTAPTVSPTTGPSTSPTTSPSRSPSLSPTTSPTREPTTSPTRNPSRSPSLSPSASPTTSPTVSPTRSPSVSPSAAPTVSPTVSPTASPTVSPTVSPSRSPSASPSTAPTVSPTVSPTTSPTVSPTATPTVSPTTSPSVSPTTSSPSTSPTRSPTSSPSRSPSMSPSTQPTTSPTRSPSRTPTTSPTRSPTLSPSMSPSTTPTISPTASPSTTPTESPRVHGDLLMVPGSPTKIPAVDLAGTLPLEVGLILKEDTFLPKFVGAPLTCGFEDDPGLNNGSKMIVISGTRRKVVADSCSGRIVSESVMEVTFVPSAELVPEEKETITLSLAPQLVRSTRNATTSASIDLEPPVYAINAALMYGAVANPSMKRTVLALEGCVPEAGGDDDEMEEVELFENPPQLALGNSRYALFYGAILFHFVAGFFFLSAISVGNLYLKCEVGDRVPKMRRWEAARYGWLLYPLMILYPSAVVVCTTVVLESDNTLAKVVSGIILFLCVCVPFACAYFLRGLSGFATYEKAEEGGSLWDRWIGGPGSWEPREDKQDEFRLFHLWFDGYKPLFRYFLVCDLTSVMIIAVVQSLRADTEEGCFRRDLAVFIVMVLYALLFTAGRVAISPLELALDVVVLWSEVICKGLTIWADPEAETNHWALQVVYWLSTLILVLSSVKLVLFTGVFVKDEWDHWMTYRHGGGETRPGSHRALTFARYWFVYHNVPRMLCEPLHKEKPLHEEKLNDKAIEDLSTTLLPAVEPTPTREEPEPPPPLVVDTSIVADPMISPIAEMSPTSSFDPAQTGAMTLRFSKSRGVLSPRVLGESVSGSWLGVPPGESLSGTAPAATMDQTFLRHPAEGSVLGHTSRTLASPSRRASLAASFSFLDPRNSPRNSVSYSRRGRTGGQAGLGTTGRGSVSQGRVMSPLSSRSRRQLPGVGERREGDGVIEGPASQRSRQARAGSHEAQGNVYTEGPALQRSRHGRSGSHETHAGNVPLEGPASQRRQLPGVGERHGDVVLEGPGSQRARQRRAGSSLHV
eukprot:Hpha_TRINITY_DN15527_c2_g1::TRINITY_DN15527_c2_g1_i1::g.106071::m.106071